MASDDRDDRDDDRVPWAAPSVWYALDPALVVLQRERLRLTWQALSQANRRAINRWLVADGGNRPTGLTRAQTTCAASAREAGRQALALYG